MPRINHINSCRKPLPCGKCGETIEKGQPYRWAKPWKSRKRVRCLKTGCRFRPTDLSPSKSAIVEEALEDASTAIQHAHSLEELRSPLEDVCTVLEDIESEWQEASDAWTSGYNERFQTNADACSELRMVLEDFMYRLEEDEDEDIEVLRDEIENELIGFSGFNE